MVTTKNAAQRRATKKKGVTKRKGTRKTTTRRSTIRRLISRIARARMGKKYRQLLVGEKSLNYPFDAEATPTRSAERQKIVEEYARQLLPPATYNVLKNQGVRWFPSDAERVRKHVSESGRKRALEFIASMFVVDSAHALLEELFIEVEDMTTKGALGESERRRINGIITNITNKPIAPPGTDQVDMRPGAQNPMNDESNINVLYPIAYTLDIQPNGQNARFKIADDLMLFRLVKSISQGVIAPKNFSLTCQLKVFSRLFPKPDDLPIDMRGMAPDADGVIRRNGGQRININRVAVRELLLDAEKLDEAAVRDSEMSEPTALGVVVAINHLDSYPDTLNTQNIQMPLKDGFIGGMTIQAREVQELRAGMLRLLQLCKELSHMDTGFNGDVLNEQQIDLVPVGICPRGKVPAFFDANKRPIAAWEDGNGFIRAPGYRSVECIPVRSKSVGLRSVTNMPVGTAAAQRSVSARAVSLKQVEAMPKKELAKFVQRVVNMA